jgi:hypothetical protein
MKEKVYQKLRHNLSIIRFNWWLNQPARKKQFSAVYCLCNMCHQNRREKPGLTPSDFDGWCDDCFVDLPDWLRHKKTTVEELQQLKEKEEKAVISRREKRDNRHLRQKKKPN